MKLGQKFVRFVLIGFLKFAGEGELTRFCITHELMDWIKSSESFSKQKENHSNT